MTPDNVAQAIGYIWSTLELAAQGAFSASAAPGMPNAAAHAADRFTKAVAMAKRSVDEVMGHFIATLPKSEMGADEVQEELREATADLNALFTQAHHQVMRAIRAGSPAPVVRLIGDKHGGMANLIAQKTLLTLSVRDKSGRQWKSPQRLAQTIARGFAVQAQVIAIVASLRESGHTHAYVSGVEFPLHEIAHMRSVLFHHNSKEVPHVDLPA